VGDPWTAYEELAARDWEGLDPPQRALVAFGELRSDVNSGGFDAYFFNAGGDHVDVAVMAADDAGATALADLTRRALQRLGVDGNAVPDIDERQALLLTPGQEHADGAFESLDQELYALEEREDLDEAMRRLIPSD
jgi:hypothetical protein